MLKVQDKVSGCFHSTHGGTAHACNQGYVSPISKREVKCVAALETVVTGQPFHPRFA